VAFYVGYQVRVFNRIAYRDRNCRCLCTFRAPLDIGDDALRFLPRPADYLFYIS
jgi:hypothetical protein